MAETEINFPQSWQLMPCLLRLAEERSWERWELIDRLCADLNISMQERIKLAGMGRSSRTTVDIRIGQARQDLKKAGLVTYPAGKWLAITPQGKAFLWQNTGRTEREMALSLCLIMGKKIKRLSAPVQISVPEKPPLEILGGTRAQLSGIVLNFLCAESPFVFEHLSLEIVKRMWPYPVHKGIVTPQTGDGGVDGIVQFDELGHHITAFQSKRNAPENKVGSDRIQAFKGAMIDQGLRNGVFLTTSDYTSAARDVAKKQEHIRITLINGAGIVEQMRKKKIGLIQDFDKDFWQIDVEFFKALRKTALEKRSV